MSYVFNKSLELSSISKSHKEKGSSQGVTVTGIYEEPLSYSSSRIRVAFNFNRIFRSAALISICSKD
jgi:hypothetical protein